MNLKIRNPRFIESTLTLGYEDGKLVNKDFKPSRVIVDLIKEDGHVEYGYDFTKEIERFYNFPKVNYAVFNRFNRDLYEESIKIKKNTENCYIIA